LRATQPILGQERQDVRVMIDAGPAFRIERTEHTGITVSSLDEALSFWSGVMGFQHLYTWDFDRGSFLDELVGVKAAAARITMVTGPGHLIELLEYRSPNDRQVMKPRSCDVGSVHVAFRVETSMHCWCASQPRDGKP
jgi:catechol 2,3-dioxygenase-like lactoylglutathione lyase family enzyme